MYTLEKNKGGSFVQVGGEDELIRVLNAVQVAASEAA